MFTETETGRVFCACWGRCRREVSCRTRGGPVWVQCLGIPFNSLSAQVCEDSAIAHVDGEPYAVRWTSSRPRVPPSTKSRQTLVQAFSWPQHVCSILREVKEEQKDMTKKPLICAAKILATTSHFSGVCTQSRAGQVLENNGSGLKFKHVARLCKFFMCIIIIIWRHIYIA